MKKLLYAIGCLVALILGVTACKPDVQVTPQVPKGTLVMKINPVAGTDPFVINQRYTTPDGQKYALNQLSFYIGDIFLETKDHTLVPLKDIVYAKIERPLTNPYDSNTIGTSFPFTVAAGDYIGIQYGLGVPPKLNGIQNHTYNPNQYPLSHPLSAYRGTAWDWAGYKFAMVAGDAYDSTGLNHTIEYHEVTDEMYTPVSQPWAIHIQDKDTTTLVMNLDVNKLFYQQPKDTNNINLLKEPFSHSQGAVQLSIAHRIMHNLSTAFTPTR